jgi:hypothetical protein
MRFNGPELGAWYAADDIRTAAAEVGHHLRRETVAHRRPQTFALIKLLSAGTVWMATGCNDSIASHSQIRFRLIFFDLPTCT